VCVDVGVNVGVGGADVRVGGGGVAVGGLSVGVHDGMRIRKLIIKIRMLRVFIFFLQDI
jgi:hypothetical protein